MHVRQILNSKAKGLDDVVCIGPDKSVAEAAQLLAQRRIGAVVVSPDGAQPVGILSERDIVREVGRRGSACLDDPVRRMMTAEIVACAPEDTADRVLEQMTSLRFRHMPVVEAGQMIGLISIGDVVKARIDELAMEKEALEGMIMGF